MSAKLFLGHRLRRLRRDHQMSQTDMATSLAISPSYLNHLERNQRPVTAALLLKLAEQYEVDVRSFAANGGGAKTGPDALVEIFSDVLLSDLGVPRYELVELANNAPSVADAIAIGGEAANIDLILLGEFEQQRGGHRPLVAFQVVEIAGADRKAQRHVGLRQLMVAAKPAETMAEEKLAGHFRGSVNFAQRSQVKF